MTISLVSVSPSAGATITLTRPPVQFVLSSNEREPTIQLRFWISRSPNPSADPDAITNRLVTVLYYAGYATNTTIPMSLPDGSYTYLTPGTWYIQARVSNSDGSVVFGEVVQQFSVVFTPYAGPMTPAPGEVRPFVDTTNNFMVTWTYSGSQELADQQTAYQVIVNRVDNGTLVADTGKVFSTIGQGILTIPNTQKDVELSWRVRVWNKWDYPSAYSNSNTFLLASAFSLTITSPANGQTINAGNPNLTVSIAISGGRTVKAVNASAWQNDIKLWEKTVFGNWGNGASLNITDSVSVFKIASYTYRVVAQDNFGTYSNEVTRNFNVSYQSPDAPPGAPTVSTGSYEDAGYIQVGWSDSTRGVDFYAWEVQRRDDIINVNTKAVLEMGTWEGVGRVYGTAPSYVFLDYLAPSNHRVTYRIVQIALTYGVEVVSSPSPTSNSYFPISTNYWLYAGTNGDPGAVIMKLWNVTGDNFTDEQESAEFPLIGRGRYSERGTHLGVRGTLEMKLRDEDTMSARQKRLHLAKFKDAYPSAKLRNPYGDLYVVTLNDISVTRIPGTGKSEFTDVTIPYVEVVS